MNKEMFSELYSIGLIPVIKIENADDAVPLAKALIEGGLPAAEITFRTAAAADAIKAISEAYPDMLIGAGTVLMPFGGKYQRTPIQAMVQKISVERGHTDLASYMSWGYNPDISTASPYHGAYLAVVESCAKLLEDVRGNGGLFRVKGEIVYKIKLLFNGHGAKIVNVNATHRHAEKLLF